MAPDLLVDRPPWRVLYRPGTGPALLVACASIGHDPTRPPQPEFQRLAAALEVPALFVTDAARSWATAPGLAPALVDALALVRSRHEVSRIVTLGVSMGGFLALCAARHLPVDATLAIGPQHQPAAPWERRWRRWTAALPPDLTAPPPAAPWTVLIHGQADDSEQALAFPPAPGLDRLLFPGPTHAALARHLTSQGGLQGMTQSLLQGDRRRLLRIAAQAGAIRPPSSW